MQTKGRVAMRKWIAVLAVAFALDAGRAEAADVTLVSESAQTFAWTNETAALSDVTITATDTGGVITNGVIMTLRVPSAWQCRFDTTVTPTLSGAAATKIGATGYDQGGRWLTLPVTNDFVNGDTLTVAGLKLLDLTLCRAGAQRLELDYDGDGVTNVVDTYTLSNAVVWAGGSYDGWDRNTMAAGAGLGGADVALSSGANQTFAWTNDVGVLNTVTVLVTAAGTPAVITNGVTIKLSVPAAWQCRFDAGATPSLGGGAQSKVNATATYSGDGRTVHVAVTSDFVNGDTLTIGGLKLVDLALCRAGAQPLELDFDGDGAKDVNDAHPLTVTAIWAGGSYDGWDMEITAEYMEVYRPRGTVILLR